MNKLDLIIEFCESMANMHIKGSVHALAAARELRDMKPVGVFAYDEENKVWEELIKGSEGTTLYTLGDTDE